jgi:hypothetical protein
MNCPGCHINTDTDKVENVSNKKMFCIEKRNKELQAATMLKMIEGGLTGGNGARCRLRTCDPHRVKVMLYH